MVDKDKADALNDARRALSKWQQPLANPEHWFAKGHSALLAQELANYWDGRAKTHYLETIGDDDYERRPEALYVGHKLRRGFAKKDAWGVRAD